MNLRLRTLPAALLILLPVLSIPSAASAATSGPVRTIRGCTGDTHAAANADGTIWATSSCGAESYATPDILRPGRSWTRRGDRFAGRSLAVTDDGRFTYSVMTYHGTDLVLHKMQHDAGYYGGASLSREASAYDPTVAAVEGSYWAVWSEQTCASDGTSCRGRLFQQRSMGAAPARTQVLTVEPDSADAPSMALRSPGVVLVFVETSNDVSTQLDLAMARWDDGAWNTTVLRRGTRISSPSLAVSGGRTVVGWVEDGRPWLMIDDGALQFSAPRPVPFRAPVNALRVAASGGRAFVATSACFPYAGSTTCRVYVAEAGLAGPVVGTEVSVGSGAIRWQLEDLVAARGRATVLMDSGSSLVSRSQGG